MARSGKLPTHGHLTVALVALAAAVLLVVGMATPFAVPDRTFEDRRGDDDDLRTMFTTGFDLLRGGPDDGSTDGYWTLIGLGFVCLVLVTLAGLVLLGLLIGGRALPGRRVGMAIVGVLLAGGAVGAFATLRFVRRDAGQDVGFGVGLPLYAAGVLVFLALAATPLSARWDDGREQHVAG